jgi:nitronate monooxygenase
MLPPMRTPWETPVIQAPLGSVATPALVAAVSAAGGLGTLAGSWTPPDVLREQVRTIARATDRPFAVNLVVAFEQRERLAVLLAEAVPVISFFWGVPGDLLAEARAAGAFTMVQVGSAPEAREAAGAGAHAVIAQGVEAGGHVRGRTGLLPLLREVRTAVSVPFVAAGGIADAEGARAARAAGADAVTMGTRFVASAESAAHPSYQARLVAAGADDTVLLDDLFSVGWPDAPHRALRNDTVEGWERAGCPRTGERPGEGEVIARRGRRELVRYGDDPPLRGDEGDVDALALYCGQGVGLIDRVEPAAELVERVATAFG